MKFEKVESSNVEAIAYDKEHHLLGVQFKNSKGTFYMYHGVPEARYKGLFEQGSVGKFLNAHIIPYFMCTKVELYAAPPVVMSNPAMVVGEIAPGKIEVSSV